MNHDTKTADEMWAALLPPNAFGPVVVKKFPPVSVPKTRPYRHSLPITQTAKPFVNPIRVGMAFKMGFTLPRTEWQSVYGLAVMKAPIRDILQAVCSAFDVTMTDLLSTRRYKKVAYPRFAACLLMKELTTHSLPKMGQILGGRDHTTILHAIRRAQALEWRDDEFSEKLRQAREMARGNGDKA